MIHTNEWLWETDFLNELLRYTLCPHPLTYLLQKWNSNKTEKDDRAAAEIKERSREKASLRQIWKISIQVPSTDHLFPMCVCDRSVDLHFTLAFIPEALWRLVHAITGLCKWKLCALIFPLAGKPKSCLFLFPLHKCFPLWHVVFICWTQESVSLWVICLSSSASVIFFKPGSGNFFQCVIEGYDNYPFSISTVDMFIVLNVHLPTSLLFCIMLGNLRISRQHFIHVDLFRQ